MQESLAAARRLISARRFQQAAQLLTEVCAAAPDSLDPWTLLGLCLMAQEKRQELFALIELRQQQGNDGLELFYDCLALSIDLLDRPLVLKTIAETPRNSLLYVVALFLSGTIAACDGEVDRGIAEIKLAGRAAAPFHEHFDKDNYLQHILLDGKILEGSEAMAELEAMERKALLDAYGKLQEGIEFRSKPSHPIAAPFIFLSACDERYLDRFGATVTQALDRTGIRTVYHLHVVDPTPRLESKLAELGAGCANLDLQYSSESCRDDAAQGWSRACYYSCSRLVRLPEILAHYRRDVFMWDVDIAGVRGLDRLVAAMAGYDLGYFEMKYTIPTLLCHMAAAYFANTPATRRLAELTCRFILAKLPRAAFWTLDQASVFCASRYLQARCPEFRINSFTRSPGVKFYDIVDVAGSVDEKRRLRGTAGQAA
jgi:hypothetical protein